MCAMCKLKLAINWRSVGDRGVLEGRNHAPQPYRLHCDLRRAGGGAGKPLCLLDLKSLEVGSWRWNFATEGRG